MMLELTTAQVGTVLHALAVCSADMEDNRDNARGTEIQEYYTRKMSEYNEVHAAIYKQVMTDTFFTDADRRMEAVKDLMDRPYTCTDCACIACTDCVAMKK